MYSFLVPVNIHLSHFSFTNKKLHKKKPSWKYRNGWRWKQFPWVRFNTFVIFVITGAVLHVLVERTLRTHSYPGVLYYKVMEFITRSNTHVLSRCHICMCIAFEHTHSHKHKRTQHYTMHATFTPSKTISLPFLCCCC